MISNSSMADEGLSAETLNAISITSSMDPTLWGTLTTSTITASSTPVICANGNVSIEGNLVVKGVNLSSQVELIANKLDSIDERLAILRPNEELEQRWEKLRELRQQYIEMEKELTELDLVFDILSGKSVDPK
jgi:hypothetical protein